MKRASRGDAGDGVVPRDRILHAAAKLFHERGYSATTVRDIAAEVGILSGSIFHHFSSKEEMLLEIMNDAALAICIRAEAIIEREQSPEAQLRELIRLEFDSITRETRRHYHGVLFFEWRGLSEPAKASLRRLRKRYQQTWTYVLQRCAAAGRLRCEEQAASLILHGALRNAMTWYSPRGRYTPEQFGEILAHLVLA